MKNKCLFFLLLLTFLFVGCARKNDAASLNQYENVEFGKKSTVNFLGYAGETCYAGDVALPSYLFEVPFQKTENYYLTNKELSQLVDRFDYNNYKETFEKYINLVYGSDYRSVLKNQEQFVTDFCNLTEGIGEQDANSFLEWYIDNELTCTSNIKTDYSMIYKDDYYYILRAAVDVGVYSNHNVEILTTLNGLELINGEGKKYICEMKFCTGRPDVIIEVLWYNTKGDYITSDNYSKTHEVSMDEQGNVVFRSKDDFRPLAIDTDNGLLTEIVDYYENNGYNVWIYKNIGELSYATVVVGNNESYIDEDGVFRGSYKVAVTNKLNIRTKTTNCN